ncbi:MAG TPA: acyl-CoA dehydrogenase family protein [Acidimicrobiales bacterium]|nr:acyl-CoA dehydrogenase family protein [Acidimicrobiales bacterium]
MSKAACEIRRSFDEGIADVLLADQDVEFRSVVRAVVASKIAPAASETDRTGVFAKEAYLSLVDAGLGGLIFPKRLGGSGSTTLSYAIAVEEIAAACGATSLIFATQMHAAYPILLAGTEEQMLKYVPGLCGGSLFGSLAITEPDAGSDVSSLRTTARRDGDEYVISGSKTFITTGDRADVIVCFASIDRSSGRDGITAFLVDGGSRGLSRGPAFEKMGMHGSSTSELFFNGVRVPASALLGSEGSGWSLLLKSVVKSRVSAAAQGVGLASGAFAHLLAVLRERGSAGQDIDFELADLRTSLLEGRLLLYAGAIAADRPGGLSAAEIAMVKLACTNLGATIAYAAVRLLGWQGDLAECGVERFLRDARVTQIYDGTNEVQRLLIARDSSRRAEGP